MIMQRIFRQYNLGRTRIIIVSLNNFQIDKKSWWVFLKLRVWLDLPDLENQECLFDFLIFTIRWWKLFSIMYVYGYTYMYVYMCIWCICIVYVWICALEERGLHKGYTSIHTKKCNKEAILYTCLSKPRKFCLTTAPIFSKEVTCKWP